MRAFLLSLIAIFFMGYGYAQSEGGAKVGVNFGIPSGDADKISSIALSLDAAYLWEISNYFNGGVTSGYLSYFGKNKKGKKKEDLAYIPIALTGQYEMTDHVFVGVDLGYALGINPSLNKGGFYYLPKFGYQNDFIELYAGVKAISGRFESRSGKNTTKSNIYSFSFGFYYKFN